MKILKLALMGVLACLAADSSALQWKYNCSKRRME
jgi:hypothetical protein